VTLADIVALAKRLVDDGHTKADVFAFLDAEAVRVPDLAPAIAAAKAILGPLFDQGNLDKAFAGAIGDVLRTLRNKYGPVSDAPEIGLS
jgi:hypothetical protein